MLEILVTETIVVLIYMTLWFFIAQALRRNDIADILWGTGFIVTAVTARALMGHTACCSYLYAQQGKT